MSTLLGRYTLSLTNVTTCNLIKVVLTAGSAPVREMELSEKNSLTFTKPHQQVTSDAVKVPSPVHRNGKRQKATVSVYGALGVGVGLSAVGL